MRVVSYLYDSRDASGPVETVLSRVDDREESVERIDVGEASDPAAARREAMLRVGTATRVGPKPDAIFDSNGDPDFSIGVLITEDERGRRELHTGAAALEVL